MCCERGGPACRIRHIDEEGKGPTSLTSSSLSRRALASSCLCEMKVEQNALSPMGMPRITILGCVDLFISGENGLKLYLSLQ